MTRDETVALFLKCEAKRTESRTAALAEGKSEDEADNIAHEAAKVQWNAWATKWLSPRDGLPKKVRSGVARSSAENMASIESAKADFSYCFFSAKRADESLIEEGLAEKEASELPLKLVEVEGSVFNFRGFIFPDEITFENSIFQGEFVEFTDARFLGAARFDSTEFLDWVSFESAIFEYYALFWKTIFFGNAHLGDATFKAHTSFHDASFIGEARFGSAAFIDDALFWNVTFTDFARFNSVHFRKNADFRKSHFEGAASFEAIRAERGFSMADVVFDSVPDFIQAHFEEAPRLDNLRVKRLLPYVPERRDERIKPWVRLHRGLKKRSRLYRRVAAADRDGPARWRALKRLAIQGHDTDRELEFHAREIEAQRFAEHWPLPWRSLETKVWGSALSFWFGFFYGLFSNFGRSLLRPFAFWLLAVVAGAVFYVSQSPDMIAPRAKMERKGASAVSATAATAWHAWRLHPKGCYAGETPPKKNDNGDTPPYVGALTPSLASGTDLANEAWHLAFRNAFIVLDGSSEASHRTYGCLYGVEMYGGSNPLAVVPSAVSTVSAIQKLFSGLMIFLFGLALRNMLKVK
jgi:hypothetical protein